MPADGTAEVAVDVTLDWRPGREAVSTACSGATKSVADGAPGTTIADHRYSPADLTLGQTLLAHRRGQRGRVRRYLGRPGLSFTTQEYLVVDDFESTDNIDAGRPF